MLEICSEPLPTRKIRDIRGEVFGRLTVVSFSHVSESKGRNAYWKCVCSCGKITTISSKSLRTGASQSCGCLAKELSRERIKKTHLQGDDLYFIRVNEFIKVGRANRPDLRLGQIQASCPYLCELLLTVKGKGYYEHKIHNLLKDYHETGEWFKIDWTTLCDVTDLIFKENPSA